MENDGFSLKDWLQNTPPLMTTRSNPQSKSSKIIETRRTSPSTINLSGMKLKNLEGFNEMPNLNQLEEINLANNFLTGIKLEKTPTDAIKVLDVSQNHITTLQSNNFKMFPQLERLSLYANEITNISSDAFAGLTHLKHLGLSGNKLTAISAGTFDPLINLEILQLDNNQLSAFDPALVKNLKKLRVLNLKDNPLSDQNKNALKQNFPHVEIVF